jgi:hypothetical protein
MRRLSNRHFTALLSMMMALVALAIDLMLPAFDQIRADLGLAADSPRVAQIITVFFIGMALAQYIYGPLADRFGRKPVLYAGFAVYALGALGSLLAPNLEILLASRFVWGVGAASARVISVSVVRDYYSGDQMSRAMSYIMAVFVTVPVLAPSIGAALIRVFPWQSVEGASRDSGRREPESHRRPCHLGGYPRGAHQPGHDRVHICDDGHLLRVYLLSRQFGADLWRLLRQTRRVPVHLWWHRRSDGRCHACQRSAS